MSDDIMPVKLDLPLIIKHKDGRPPLVNPTDKYRAAANKNRELLRLKV